MELEDAKLVISNSRELIPISSGLVNFQTDFNITSKEKKPFRAVIINQESLDNAGDITMKNVPKGVFAGRIVKNSGSKDDWYIAVESDEKVDASLSIQTVEVEEEGRVNEGKIESFEPRKKKRMSLWIIVLIVGIIIAIGYVVYKFLLKKKPLKSLRIPPPAAALPTQATPPPTPKEYESPVRSEAVESDDEEEKLDLDFSHLPSV